MLIRYVSGDLPKEAVEALEEHVLVCGVCLEALEYIQIAAQAAAELRQEDQKKTSNGDPAADSQHQETDLPNGCDDSGQ
jgi:hypothetical protein